MHSNSLLSLSLLVNASLHFSSPVLLNGVLDAVELVHVALLSAVEPGGHVRTMWWRVRRAGERIRGHPLSSAMKPKRHSARGLAGIRRAAVSEQRQLLGS